MTLASFNLCTETLKCQLKAECERWKSQFSANLHSVRMACFYVDISFPLSKLASHFYALFEADYIFVVYMPLATKMS